MLRAVGLVVLVLSFVNTAISQEVPARRPPKDTVGEFWAQETNGGRLTTEGWYRTSRYFIRLQPDAPPPGRLIHVVRNSSKDKIEETARTDNWAEVSVTTDEIGLLDSVLRFKSAAQRGPGGVEILRGPVVTFHMVLSEKHWELNSDGSRGRELVGSPEWLIDCAQRDSWVNVDAVVRYLTDLRSRGIDDPTMKQNADRTLVRLKGLVTDSGTR